MTIEVTWHLILMLLLSISLIVGMFRDIDDGLDFTFFFFFAILAISWLIYGGIVFW